MENKYFKKKSVFVSIMVLGLLGFVQSVFAVDVLKNVALKNDIYFKAICKVQLVYSDKSNRKYIQLSQDNKLTTSIRLPIPDDEVKNFSVDKIEETNTGFKLNVSWGDMYYYYNREFYFCFINKKFYLSEIKVRDKIYDPQKTINKVQKLNKPVPIEKFNIFQYTDKQ
ncbi:hypothetical protein [Parabacteroides sp. FAFU027]|uniref:hypothetical protein n=1 Tax=Parabacteroides sp. FAFU027 TaxID=2922715 RepID=UPI001FB02DA1|nr:hypothetical protein [Parabacteroides sp. FAFU027]